MVLMLIGIWAIPLNSLAQEKGAKLDFIKEFEDLGTMYTDELENTELTIDFKNTGDQPLVINNVRGCCGTRIKEYPNNPVMPGEEGFIKIVLRIAPRAHAVNRTVSVISNDPDGMKAFRIRGEVVEPESLFNPNPNHSMAQ